MKRECERKILESAPSSLLSNKIIDDATDAAIISNDSFLDGRSEENKHFNENSKNKNHHGCNNNNDGEAFGISCEEVIQLANMSSTSTTAKLLTPPPTPSSSSPTPSQSSHDFQLSVPLSDIGSASSEKVDFLTATTTATSPSSLTWSATLDPLFLALLPQYYLAEFSSEISEKNPTRNDREQFEKHMIDEKQLIHNNSIRIKDDVGKDEENSDVKGMTILPPAPNYRETLREDELISVNSIHKPNNDDVDNMNTVYFRGTAELNTNQGEIEIKKESSKAEATFDDADIVTAEIQLQNNANSDIYDNKRKISVQDNGKIVTSGSAEIVSAAAAIVTTTTMSTVSAKIRRQRFRSDEEKSEDAIERLNRLRAKISGALSEVKGVLKQYSTEQSIDDVTGDNDNVLKTVERNVASTEETQSTATDDDAPMRLRFVRKIRRRSHFSEDEEGTTSADKQCEPKKEEEDDAKTLEIPNQTKKKYLNPNATLSQIETDESKLNEKAYIELKAQEPSQTTPTSQSMNDKSVQESTNTNATIEGAVEQCIKPRRKILVKRTNRRASIAAVEGSTIKSPILSSLPLNLKSQRRPSDSAAFAKIKKTNELNSATETAPLKSKMITEQINLVSPSLVKKSRQVNANVVDAFNLFASKKIATTLTEATETATTKTTMTTNTDATNETITAAAVAINVVADALQPEKVTKSLVISSEGISQINQLIVSNVEDRTQLGKAAIHKKIQSSSATSEAEKIVGNCENHIPSTTETIRKNYISPDNNQSFDVPFQPLPIIEELKKEIPNIASIVVNKEPNSKPDTVLNSQVETSKKQGVIIPKSSSVTVVTKTTVTTTQSSSEITTKPSSSSITVQSKMPELALVPVQIFGQPQLRHVSLLKPLGPVKTHFAGKFPLKPVLAKTNSFEKSPTTITATGGNAKNIVIKSILAKDDSFDNTTSEPRAKSSFEETTSAAASISITEEKTTVEPKVKKERIIKKKVIIRRLTRKLSVGEPLPKDIDSEKETEVVEKAIEYVKDDDVDDDEIDEKNKKEEEDLLFDPKPSKSCLKHRQFEIGDVVMYAERFKKTQVRWKKATVIERITSISYKLDVNGEEIAAHISYIKKYTDRKVNFGGKEYLDIDYEQIPEEEKEEKLRKYCSIWDMV